MLETDRLILREWRESDLEEWVAMNASPEVMKYFPKTLTTEQSTEMFQRLQTRIELQGWGLWAVEVKDTDPFIGFIGLSEQNLGLDWMPCTEIGWRLKESAWGKGYATEGAHAALAFGLERFETIYSFTSALNEKSRKVMERIGMRARPDLAFEHPRVDDLRLKSHIVYSTSSHF